MSLDKPAQFDVQLGARLRDARLAADFSQSDLGKHLGLTFQQVQKYEKGANRIPAGKVMQIAAVLGVDPADLLGLPPLLSEAVAAALRLPGVVPLLRAYARLPAGHLRRALIRLAEALHEPWTWHR